MSLHDQINRFAGKFDEPYAFAPLTPSSGATAIAEAVVKILALELAYQANQAELAMLQQKVATDGVVAVVGRMTGLPARIQAFADALGLPPASSKDSNRTALILGVGLAIAGLTLGIAYFVHRQRAQRERGVISGGKPLTTKQIEALKQIRDRGPANPFDFGSTTVSRLRKEGLVENDRSTGANRLVITEAGRKLIGG